MNEIVFPAAILQPPFFDMKADDAVNYGGIGAVIGHEIGHGFDDQGSKSDGDGNMINWWTDADRKEFETRAEDADRPVQRHSSRLQLPGQKVNGALTIGENIGDLGGLTIAYKAYSSVARRSRTAPVIDGLTGDQRFFIGWAQAWRTKYTRRRAGPQTRHRSRIRRPSSAATASSATCPSSTRPSASRKATSSGCLQRRAFGSGEQRRRSSRADHWIARPGLRSDARNFGSCRSDKSPVVRGKVHQKPLRNDQRLGGLLA